MVLKPLFSIALDLESPREWSNPGFPAHVEFVITQDHINI